jgi:hypothetical protein
MMRTNRNAGESAKPREALFEAIAIVT